MAPPNIPNYQNLSKNLRSDISGSCSAPSGASTPCVALLLLLWCQQRCIVSSMQSGEKFSGIDPQMGVFVIPPPPRRWVTGGITLVVFFARFMRVYGDPGPRSKKHTSLRPSEHPLPTAHICGDRDCGPDRPLRRHPAPPRWGPGQGSGSVTAATLFRSENAKMVPGEHRQNLALVGRSLSCAERAWQECEK